MICAWYDDVHMRDDDMCKNLILWKCLKFGCKSIKLNEILGECNKINDSKVILEKIELNWIDFFSQIKTKNIIFMLRSKFGHFKRWVIRQKTNTWTTSHNTLIKIIYL